MKERVYIVNNTETNDNTFVVAANPSQAINYVVKGKYTARVGQSLEVAKSLGKGSGLHYAKPVDDDGEAPGIIFGDRE